MKKIIYILTLAITVLSVSSCTESEVSFLDLSGDLGFTGSTEDIQEFLSLEAYQSLIDLGVPINTGSNPPEIEGRYLMSPNALKNTNIPSDPFDIGHIFANKEITFTNQNNDDLSIAYFGRQIDANGTQINSESSTESFISGNGDSFTVITRVEGEISGNNGTIFTTQGLAISGSISSVGVLNIDYAFVLISKTNDIDDEIIDEGEGRAFEDLDGLAERQ